MFEPTIQAIAAFSSLNLGVDFLQEGLNKNEKFVDGIIFAVFQTVIGNIFGRSAMCGALVGNLATRVISHQLNKDMDRTKKNNLLIVGLTIGLVAGLAFDFVLEAIKK